MRSAVVIAGGHGDSTRARGQEMPPAVGDATLITASNSTKKSLGE